jgi:hypothetical protein
VTLRRVLLTVCFPGLTVPEEGSEASDFVDDELSILLSTVSGKLNYAHGVTWDKERECLWALGDCLYRINFAEGKLTIKKRIELPNGKNGATGHDLFPLREEAKLLVSNNAKLFLFDIETEKFETVSELRGIKSASQHLDGTIWITDTAKPKEGGSGGRRQEAGKRRIRRAS